MNKSAIQASIAPFRWLEVCMCGLLAPFVFLYFLAYRLVLEIKGFFLRRKVRKLLRENTNLRSQISDLIRMSSGVSPKATDFKVVPEELNESTKHKASDSAKGRQSEQSNSQL